MLEAEVRGLLHVIEQLAPCSLGAAATHLELSETEGVANGARVNMPCLEQAPQHFDGRHIPALAETVNDLVDGDCFTGKGTI